MCCEQTLMGVSPPVLCIFSLLDIYCTTQSNEAPPGTVENWRTKSQQKCKTRRLGQNHLDKNIRQENDSVDGQCGPQISSKTHVWDITEL